MSAVIKAIGNIIHTVAVIARNIVKTVWKEVLLPALGVVFSVFGIKDEDVISAKVISVKMFDDNDTVADTITKIALAHQKNDKQKMSGILTQYLDTARGSFRSYFNNGKNTYLHGLPDTNLQALTVSKTDTENVISSEIGTTATISTIKVDTPDKYEYYKWLYQSKYNYNPATGTLTYTGADGITHTDYEINYINYVYSDNTYDITISRNNTSINTPIVLNEVAYVPEVYIIATYYTVDANEWKYWLYDTTTGTHPEIAPKNSYITQLEMFPMVTVRNNAVNVNTDKTTAEYKCAKSILNTIGIDINTLTDGINDNPDIDKLEDAFVTFAVNPTDSSPAVSKVLFEMFDYIFLNQNATASVTSSGTHVGEVTYTATFKADPANLGLTWADQTRTTELGVIGDIDTYTHSVVDDSLVLKKQVTAGYVTTIVLNTVASVTFIDRQGLVGLVAMNLGDENFSIPLSHHVVDKLSPMEQLELLQYALRLSLYAADVVHLKWYQTPAFSVLMKGILTVILIVSVIITLGTSASLAAAFYTGLVDLVAGYGISLALHYLMHLTDNPWIKAVIVTAAVMLGAYTGYLDISTLQHLAETSLTIVTNFSSIASDYYDGKINSIKEQAKQLESTYDVFNTKVEGYYDSVSELSTEFVAYLKSVDTMMYIAKGGPMYDYSSMYSYDAFVSDYYDNKLQLSIV